MAVFQEAMLKVGLTGGIATGKSTVAKIFENSGAKLIDADLISREIMKKGKAAYKKILSHFGEEMLKADGEIDRAKLGKIVFSNPDELKILSDITHPIIIETENEISDKLSREAQSSIVIVNAALLIEAGTYQRFDKIILVYASIDTQIERLVKRDNMDKQVAIDRIKSQMSFEEKRRFADYIVDNDGDLQNALLQCKEIYSDLLKLDKA